MICGHLNNKSMKPTKRSSFLTLNLSQCEGKLEEILNFQAGVSNLVASNGYNSKEKI